MVSPMLFTPFISPSPMPLMMSLPTSSQSVSMIFLAMALGIFMAASNSFGIAPIRLSASFIIIFGPVVRIRSRLSIR